MSTSLVLGNGSMLVNINDTLNIKDLYWPFVGEANHLSQIANVLFFYINGNFVRLNSESFLFETNYLDNSLIGSSVARSEIYNLEIQFTDLVFHDRDIFLRKIEFNNLGNNKLDLIAFFKHNYYMREDDSGNTATWYEPAKLMCHYKKNTYLGMGFCSKVYQYTCASPIDNNEQGAFPQSNGNLPFNPVSTGTTQSCMSAKLEVEPEKSQILEYFIVCGQNYHDITEQASFIRRNDRQELEDKTNFYWQNWINPKTHIVLYAEDSKNKLLEKLYSRSLLILRTQTDNHGGIIASNDSDFVKQGGKDSYSYMWPRDGAYTAMALTEAGYQDLAKNFFKFCNQAITEEGFLHHKYYSDLSKGIGSSWHPWIDKYGNSQLPIQEDETASVVTAIYHYYEHFEDVSLISELWNSFIVPALNFLIDYRFNSEIAIENNPLAKEFENSRLPKPSYDLWEIHWGIHSYTVATVYQALIAGAKLAETQKFEHLIEICTNAAEEIKTAYIEKFFNHEERTFINSIYCDERHSKPNIDKGFDSSMHSLWQSGMFSPDDARIKQTIEQLEDKLWLNTEIGGMARKNNDHYLKADKNTPGNPWFISTLWMAQYYLKIKQPEKARKYIDWVVEHADHTGLMAEQAHPHTGFSLSMKPLTWSHADFVRTLNMV